MNNHRKTYILSGVILSVVCLVSILAFRPYAQTNPKQQEQEDPPTPIQRGVKTEKQRKHSKRYEEESLILKPSLIDEDSEIYVSIFSGPMLTDANSPNKSRVLQSANCKSNAVIKGKIREKNSQLTENESFVFTDYEVDVGEVIKNDTPIDLAVTKSFTLTARGGAVKLGSRIFKVNVERNVSLRINKEYLFFLNYLADSQSFHLLDDQSFFTISTSSNKIQFGGKFYPNSSEDLGDFLNSLRQASLMDCTEVQNKREK